jgi:TusA-related sulfurtransferase
MERHPARIINIRGEYSPFSLLKISQIFREMAAGDILEIRQCDPETRSDLTRILPPETCRLVVDEAGETDAQMRKLCRIRLFKTIIDR